MHVISYPIGSEDNVDATGARECPVNPPGHRYLLLFDYQSLAARLQNLTLVFSDCDGTIDLPKLTVAATKMAKRQPQVQEADIRKISAWRQSWSFFRHRPQLGALFDKNRRARYSAVGY